MIVGEGLNYGVFEFYCFVCFFFDMYYEVFVCWVDCVCGKILDDFGDGGVNFWEFDVVFGEGVRVDFDL